MIIVTLIIFWMLRLYSSLWSYAGALEMMYVVSACILDTVVVTVLILLRNWGDMYPVPRSFYILYGLFLFVFVMGCRYLTAVCVCFAICAEPVCTDGMYL